MDPSVAKQTSDSFISGFRQSYQTLLVRLEDEAGDLIINARPLQGLFLFGEILSEIAELYEILCKIYDICFTQQRVLTHFNSQQLSRAKSKLLPTYKIIHEQSLNLPNSDFDNYDVYHETFLKELGHSRRVTHFMY